MMLRLRTIAFVAVALYAVPALAAISGSKHDFRGTGWSNNTICEPCHTPHDAYKDSGGAPITPLWNHASTIALFTPYDSDTMNATAPNSAATMHWSSKLCLSCHDGTVALDSFGRDSNGNEHIGTNDLDDGDGGFVGTDLRSEHPVGFLYNNSLTQFDNGGNLDTELHSLTHVGSTGQELQKYYLFQGYVGCASCHDVHNSANQTWGYMLRANPVGSALCLDCHNK